MNEEWVQIADVSDFATADRKLVHLKDDRIVVLFSLPDGYYAVDGWCSHDKGAMIRGMIHEHEVSCPTHGARFDLRTGKNLSLPAVKPIRRYEVKVDGTKILVKA